MQIIDARKPVTNYLDTHFIKNDMEACLYFCVNYQRQKPYPYLFWSIFPFLSLIAFEAYTFLKQQYPTQNHNIDKSFIIHLSTARNRFKFFYSKQQPHVDDIYRGDSSEYQDNFSFTFYNKYPIYSEESTAFNSTYDLWFWKQKNKPKIEDRDKNFYKPFSEIIIKYFLSILTKSGLFGLRNQNYTMPSLNEDDFQEDVIDCACFKSKVISNCILSHKDIIHMFVTLNYVIEMLHEVIHPTYIHFIFRMKYLLLYHYYKRLSVYYYQKLNLADKTRIQYLEGVLKKINRHFFFNKTKDLRDNIMHNKYKEPKDFSPNYKEPFLGLISFYYGKSFNNVHEQLDNDLKLLRNSISEWLKWCNFEEKVNP
jgi:hypothetical protein